MKKVLILLGAAVSLLVLSTLASAQIPIPWMPEGVKPLVYGFENPPVIDGVLDEWAEIPEDYYFTTEQFTPRPAGKKVEIDLTDLAVTVWNAWCPGVGVDGAGAFFFACQWYDNMCRGAEIAADPEFAWDQTDIWELEVDADGSGGQVYVSEGDAAYVRRHKNAQAQQYGINGIPGNIWYHHKGWPVKPPFTEVASTFEGTQDGEGTMSMEVRITPFNDLSIDEELYELQTLEPGWTCRLQHEMLDTDEEVYHMYLVLNGADGSYLTSDKWIEFELDEVTPGSGPTAVQQTTWGQMKAQFK